MLSILDRLKEKKIFTWTPVPKNPSEKFSSLNLKNHDRQIN